jgi:putative ABC transport system ATP-binding protein
MTTAVAPGGGETLVRAENLVKSYGAVAPSRVVSDVSCCIRAGELVLLMGPSGSGKTTLLSMLAGILRPTSGSVTLCGHPVSEYSEEQAARVRRERVGFVFQDYRLFRALTACENVAAILGLGGLPRRDALDRAQRALEEVGLGECGDRIPSRLSGGQKQRVALARALALEPALIVGDEVTAALDSESAMIVMACLRARVNHRTGVLIVTHDHRLEAFADRVCELLDGRLVQERVLPTPRPAGPA